MMKARTLTFALLAASPLAAQQPEAARGAELFGAGVFSTGRYELPPTFTRDGRTAWFTVSTPAYGRYHAILETHWDGSRWSDPQLAPFSGQHADADPLLSPDGARLFFLSRLPAPGRAPERQDFDIWFVARTGAGWSEPQHVAAASGPEDEHYASVAADGTLYIAALRADSRGRGDIYRVPFVDGAYGTPENLGAAVNSPDHHDTTPWIAPDQSYLIFGSFGRPEGTGAPGDLYVSFRRDGAWTPARNLGPLVNSRRTEYCPVVSPDGRFLYFASERGFADAPRPAQFTTAALDSALGAPGNGLGDTWRIELERVWEALGERP